MERMVLAGELDAGCRLSGSFTLRSGALSAEYFDKYLFESLPVLLREVAEQAASLIPADVDVLAGLELGGIPVVTALSLVTGLPAVFVRKQAKEYGTAKLAEGTDIRGRRLLIVEDVMTTGGQVVTSSHDLRSLGATVETVLCVIDRSGGDHSRLIGAGLTVRALFTSADLDDARAESSRSQQ